jgi:hypothetical protein
MLLASVIAAAAAAVVPPQACTATSPAHQVALVELFTSQGCSSCPPADRWLGQLAARTPRNRVVPIALHVDYWDYIGWKDPYARSEFTARQRALAVANGSRTVYTPGVFIQSQEFPPWAQADRFDEAVRIITSAAAAVRVTLSATIAAGEVQVQTSAVAQASAREPRLRLALVESGLATRVRAGENRGETLTNDRVVRAWVGPLPLQSTLQRIPLPAGTDPGRLAVVAIVEDASGRVLQALDLTLHGC